MITQGMYRQAISQNDSELLQVAYLLDTWLTKIEEFVEKRDINTVLNTHPLVVTLAHKLFIRTYPQGIVRLQDCRVIPGVYLSALVKWLIKTINGYTEGLSWTNIDGKFLNVDQLVQWIVLRIAEMTYCDLSTFKAALAVCEHVARLSKGEARRVIDSDRRVHFIDTPKMASIWASQDLCGILQSFSKIIGDASVLCSIESMRMGGRVPERRA
ncbi:MAG: hypothetical protein PVI90_00410 [Desulfobacteraceae bacterium]|jgi:hypothetical protein